MDPKTNQCKKPEALPKIECTPLRKGELPATTKKPEPVKRKLPTVQEQIREEEAKVISQSSVDTDLCKTSSWQIGISRCGLVLIAIVILRYILS